MNYADPKYDPTRAHETNASAGAALVLFVLLWYLVIAAFIALWTGHWGDGFRWPQTAFLWLWNTLPKRW